VKSKMIEPNVPEWKIAVDELEGISRQIEIRSKGYRNAPIDHDFRSAPSSNVMVADALHEKSETLIRVIEFIKSVYIGNNTDTEGGGV
jgi:hypothetical protein